MSSPVSSSGDAGVKDSATASMQGLLAVLGGYRWLTKQHPGSSLVPSRRSFRAELLQNTKEGKGQAGATLPELNSTTGNAPSRRFQKTAVAIREQRQ